MAVLPRGILGIISFREYGLHVLNMVQCTWKPVNTDTKGTCYSVRIIQFVRITLACEAQTYCY